MDIVNGGIGSRREGANSMTRSREVDHEQIVAMLRAAAEEAGTTLRAFYELGSRDQLDNPRLRDLWLIWGDELDEGDLTVPV
jgi:hypothetical protein